MALLREQVLGVMSRGLSEPARKRQADASIDLFVALLRADAEQEYAHSEFDYAAALNDLADRIEKDEA